MAKRRILFLAVFGLIVLAAFIALVLSAQKAEFRGAGLTFLSRCVHGQRI